MSLSAALSGFAMSGGLIMAIGAQNAFVLRQGIKGEHILAVVLLCMVSDIFCITLGVVGVGGLIASHTIALQIATWGGALFLTYYGIMALKRVLQGSGSLTVQDSSEAQGNSLKAVILMCLAFTFLNPGVYLDTMVLLGSVSTHFQNEQKWWFAVGACSASIIWFASLGWGARQLAPLFKSPRAWQVFDGIVAVMMFALAWTLISNPITPSVA